MATFRDHGGDGDIKYCITWALTVAMVAPRGGGGDGQEVCVSNHTMARSSVMAMATLGFTAAGARARERQSEANESE